MKLEKAIEILQVQVASKPNYRNPDLLNALRLGIEALKRFEAYRLGADWIDPSPLPGETGVWKGGES